MRCALLCVALAACGSTAATSHDTADPLSQHVDHPPTTPAPHIAWKDGAFDVQLLPAIARASEVIVLPVMDSDGARGMPNLRIEVRDRNDKLLQTIAVQTTQQSEAAMAAITGGGPLPADVQKRIDDANHQLEVLHGVHDLQPMKPLAVEAKHDDEDQHWATGDNLDIEWREHHLRVFRHNEKSALVDRDGTPWLAPDHDAGGLHCSNPAFLSAVYHAPKNNVVVAAIGYRGNDSCWEPSDQLHVITWY